jgi:nickel-dependent lactate racemase
MGIREEQLKEAFLEGLSLFSDRKKILIVPPDITRIHGMAGTLTCWAVDFFKSKVRTILPALGTHAPMTDNEIDLMFPGIDHSLFAVHDWRNDVVSLGTVPAAYIEELSEGQLSWSWEAQVNKLIASGEYDLILSIGQVVPHEVIGMANYNKNIFVGTGGPEGINKSHYLGAVYGMERILGQTDSPVRSVLDYAQEHFARHLPIEYALTVMKGRDAGPLPVGLFMSNERDCFEAASSLSSEVNVIRLEKAPGLVVVNLDPTEYRSTWLGNKSIYRTRMAIAGGGRLIVIAPGVKTFGEDKEIDRLIRNFGYCGKERIMAEVARKTELSRNLAAAAHLIHGSSEGRFTITYCPKALSRQEVESVGYEYGDIGEMETRFQTRTVESGWNSDIDGNSYYYITNPASGLWVGPNR